MPSHRTIVGLSELLLCVIIVVCMVPTTATTVLPAINCSSLPTISSFGVVTQLLAALNSPPSTTYVAASMATLAQDLVPSLILVPSPPLTSLALFSPQLPPNITIVSAYLQVDVAAINAAGGNMSLTVLVDTRPNQPLTTPYTSRTFTQGPNWLMSGTLGRKSSPDLAIMLQSMTNQPSWSSNSTLSLLLLPVVSTLSILAPPATAWRHLAAPALALDVLDVCTPNPCLNSGRCMRLVSPPTAACVCPSGFGDDVCGTNLLLNPPCPSTQQSGISWPATLQSRSAVTTCPAGSLGQARRLCCGLGLHYAQDPTGELCLRRGFGTWMAPDYSTCTNPLLAATINTLTLLLGAGGLVSSLAARLAEAVLPLTGLLGCTDLSLLCTFTAQLLGVSASNRSSYSPSTPPPPPPPGTLVPGALNDIVATLSAILASPQAVLAGAVAQISAQVVTLLVERMQDLLSLSVATNIDPGLWTTQSYSYPLLYAAGFASRSPQNFSWLSASQGSVDVTPAGVSVAIPAAAFGGGGTSLAIYNDATIFILNSTLQPAASAVMSIRLSSTGGGPLPANISVGLGLACAPACLRSLRRAIAAATGAMLDDIEGISLGLRDRTGGLSISYTLLSSTSRRRDTTQAQEFAGQAVCAWWDYTEGNWNTSGCSLSLAANNTIHCTCSHLTNFAVLVAADSSVQTQASTTAGQALSVLTMIGCVLSIVGLLLLVGTLVALRHEKFITIHHYILVNLALALAA